MQYGTMLVAYCPDALSSIYFVKPTRFMNIGTAARLPPIGADDPLREDNPQPTGLNDIDANNTTSDNITIFSNLDVSGFSDLNQLLVNNNAILNILQYYLH
jgi:hypothetical protein